VMLPSSRNSSTLKMEAAGSSKMLISTYPKMLVPSYQTNRLQDLTEWTLWTGWPTPKSKNRRQKYSPRTIKMTAINLKWLAPYQGTTWDKQS
jgi:hypothetical protein